VFLSGCSSGGGGAKSEDGGAPDTFRRRHSRLGGPEQGGDKSQECVRGKFDKIR